MSELRSAVEALRSETLPDLPDARIEEDFAELQRVCELLELERLYNHVLRLWYVFSQPRRFHTTTIRNRNQTLKSLSLLISSVTSLLPIARP